MEKPELKEVIAEFHLPSKSEMDKVKRHIKLRSSIFLGGVSVDKSGDEQVVHKYEDARDAFPAYKAPDLPLDLNEGFDPDVDTYGSDKFKEPKTDVIINGLKVLGIEEIVSDGAKLAKIIRCHEPDAPRFLTFRNSLNKIMLTAYDRGAQWRIRVSRDLNNLIKLEIVDFESNFCDDVTKMKRFIYWGRRFEEYCFPKAKKLCEYMALEVTSIGHHTVIFGAEIDGYDPRVEGDENNERGC